MRNLLLCLAVLALPGCNGSMLDRLREPEAPPPPPSMLAPCLEPVTLPEGGLSDQGVEILWGRDRDALRQCANRHRALVGWPR